MEKGLASPLVSQPVNCGCRGIGEARPVVEPPVVEVRGMVVVVGTVVLELEGTGSVPSSELMNDSPGAGKGIRLDSTPAG